MFRSSPIVKTVVGLTLLLTGLGIWASARTQKSLAVAWQNDLEHASSGEIGVQMQRAWELGKDAWPQLTAALGSEHELVRLESKRLLEGELARWHRSWPVDGSIRVQLLAKALAGGASELDVDGRRVAGDLAAGLLDFVPRLPADRRARVLADCRAIFATSRVELSLAESGDRSTLRNSTGRTSPSDAEDAATSQSTRDSTQVQPAIDQDKAGPVAHVITESEALAAARRARAARAKSAGSSTDQDDPKTAARNSVTGPRLLPGERSRRQAAPVPGGSPRLRSPTARQLNHISPDSESAAASMNIGQQIEPRSAKFSREDGSPDDAIENDESQPALPIASDQVDSMLGRGAADLVMQLSSTQSEEVDAAELELATRGLKPADLAVLRVATSAEVTDRLQLVDDLPSWPAIDVKRWLIWLSHDRSAEVRRAVAATLATGAEPWIATRLRELAADDEDAEVREIAAKSTRRRR